MSNYEIARQIKPIRLETLEPLFIELRTNYKTIRPLSIKYNDIADYFTFEERLNTVGCCKTNENLIFIDLNISIKSESYQESRIILKA